ncbi:MAG TPA: beta-ketoacyl synthase N-terminal-like domain-containing protein [Kineosporiaceae bacterium]
MTRPVVVTGLGIVSSIGTDVAAFAASLRAGRSGVVTSPGPGGEPVLSAPLTGFAFPDCLHAVAGLDGALRSAVRKAGHRAPVWIQAALHAATQAWLDAGLERGHVAPDRVGVVVGGNNVTTGYALGQRDVFAREPRYLPTRYPLHVEDTHQVGAVSQALGITGEGCTVGASSSSGNAAVLHAARMVTSGAADACLAIGALHRLDPQARAALGALGVLAPGPAAADGFRGPVHPRPFDADRAGLVPGEAAACVVIEAVDVVRHRCQPPRAVLAAAAQVLDANSLSSPDPAGEARAVRVALDRAGVAPDEVGYVNAHATATPSGDDAEAAALADVFGRPGPGPWVNATKALVGHTLSAAGVVEAVATVVQLEGGFVHPNPHLDRPAGTRLRLVGRQAEEVRVRWAVSNSFGFGGFNSCLVLGAADAR